MTGLSDDEDQAASIGIAMEWVSRILAVSAVMVLPGIAGGWLDGRWGTAPALMLIGFGFGISLGIYQLLAMSKPRRKNGDKRNGKQDENESGSAR